MVIYACLTRFSLHDVDRVTQHSRNDSIGTAVGRGAARGVTGMFAGLYHCHGGWKDGLVVETGYMHKVYLCCRSNIL